MGMKKRKQTNESENENKKERSSLFESISKLESSDVRAAKLRRVATSRSICKSFAARSQVDIHSDLVECRILFQRALNHHGSDDDDDDNDDNDDDAKERNEKMDKSLDDLLALLLQCRKRLCLPSDHDSSNNNENESEYQRHLHNDCHNDGTSSLETVLENEYETSRSKWKKVLNKCHSDLRLRSGLAAKNGAKFKVVEQSFSEQVDAALNHERLIHFEPPPPNQKDHPNQNHDHASAPTPRHHPPSHGRVFEDGKLYQQILREFVASRAEGPDAGREAANRLERASKAADSSSMVDRKASKGRKIRYVVEEKLVHFCFPVSRNVFAAIGENLLFPSLFGGRKGTRRD